MSVIEIQTRNSSKKGQSHSNLSRKTFLSDEEGRRRGREDVIHWGGFVTCDISWKNDFSADDMRQGEVTEWLTSSEQVVFQCLCSRAQQQDIWSDLSVEKIKGDYTVKGFLEVWFNSTTVEGSKEVSASAQLFKKSETNSFLK